MTNYKELAQSVLAKNPPTDDKNRQWTEGDHEKMSLMLMCGGPQPQQGLLGYDDEWDIDLMCAYYSYYDAHPNYHNGEGDAE